MNLPFKPAPTLPERLQYLRQAHRQQPYPDWPTRSARLHTLKDLLHTHAEAMCTAINKDFGCRPSEETRALELFPSLSGIKHALRHGRRWMRTRRHWASFWFLPGRTALVPQPVGVVGVIVPWNYPLYLAVGPITDALVAGNRVMVKMSEFTPAFSALFARLVATHFPDGEIDVVTGDAEVARAFSSLPFDHLLFTGSTAVGRHVMRAAADNLTPVTLELGGKSPAIIGPGARFEHAVERIVYGKSVNAGQTCIAPDYVLLPRGRLQDFIRVAQATYARMYPKAVESHQYASVITDQKYARLADLRDAAIRQGAWAHVLGADDVPSVRHMPLTLLTGVADDAQVMQEEIFGPLLPILVYETLDEALDRVATLGHPLALYLFETDQARIRRAMQRNLAGGVSINDTLYHIAQHHLPFGGVGDSGMGAYHGEAGFRTFSKMKPVFRQARFNGVGLFNPPYGARFQRLLKLLLR